MRLIRRLFLSLLLMTLTPLCFGMQNVFYILRSNTPGHITSTQHAYEDLIKNYKSIDVLVTQAYQIDADGSVGGYVDPDVYQFANDHHIKLVILVTNKEFDLAITKKFLADPKAQTKAINSIVNACKKYHFNGVQWDFEMLPIEYKSQLTDFYVQASQALRKQGFSVSYAVSPLVEDDLFSSIVSKKLYDHWQGVFDFKTLAEHADFLSIMTYNQHGGKTTPGPTADIQWMEAAIKYALQYMPASKISLGIPLYSSYWFTNMSLSYPTAHIEVSNTGIPYDKTVFLAKKYHTSFIWNEPGQFNYAMYQHNWLYEYLFVEDAKSFAAKLALAKKYHLNGISAFDLGNEDPAIWQVLAS